MHLGKSIVFVTEVIVVTKQKAVKMRLGWFWYNSVLNEHGLCWDEILDASIKYDALLQYYWPPVCIQSLINLIFNFELNYNIHNTVSC